MHWLRWNDFVPASDALLKKEIAPEAEKALGIKLNIETINGNDLQARTTSAIQSGVGPDVICGLNNWPQLYAESVANVDDVVEEIGKAQGGFYEELKVVANNGQKWLGVPWCVLGAMIVYRKSWFAEQGANSFPATWEEYRAVGKKLKAAGHPAGQTLGHTFGDAPTFTYPYLWSWGGKEVEADGKTVVLNSKGAVDSVKFMADFWKEALDEGGLAWDDTNNNRAFLSGTICATLNGASIYLLAKSKPDTYLDEKRQADVRGHGALAAAEGPRSEIQEHPCRVMAVRPNSSRRREGKPRQRVPPDASRPKRPVGCRKRLLVIADTTAQIADLGCEAHLWHVPAVSECCKRLTFGVRFCR